jgi:hypothetical protein
MTAVTETSAVAGAGTPRPLSGRAGTSSWSTYVRAALIKNLAAK